MILPKTSFEILETLKRTHLGVLALVLGVIGIPEALGFFPTQQPQQPQQPLSSFIQPNAGGFGPQQNNPSGNQFGQSPQQPQPGQSPNLFGVMNQMGQAIGQAALNGQNNTQDQRPQATNAFGFPIQQRQPSTPQQQTTNAFGFPMQQNQKQAQQNTPFNFFSPPQQQNNTAGSTSQMACCCPYCRNNPNNQTQVPGGNAAYTSGVPQTTWGGTTNFGAPDRYPAGSYGAPQAAYNGWGQPGSFQNGAWGGGTYPTSQTAPQQYGVPWTPYGGAQIQSSVHPFDREAVPKEVYDTEMSFSATR